jgi:hypothetical protein
MENGKPALTIEGNIGSKSGPATAKAAYKQVRWATLALSNSGIDVVASGGIANCEAIGARAARQLKKVMDIGAVAGAGTTFFYEQVEDWREDVYRLLKEFSDQP